MTEAPHAHNRMEFIWFVLSLTPEGHEGLVSYQMNGAWYPLMCSEPANVPRITAMATKMLDAPDGPVQQGIRFRIVRFDSRVDLDEVMPSTIGNA
jgi:hypothetical protein